MIPSPSTALYLNFIFALVYCILNICFGLALQASSIVFEKTTTADRANGVARAFVKTRGHSAVQSVRPRNGSPSVAIAKSIMQNGTNDNQKTSTKFQREAYDNSGLTNVE
jgi:hypothetical protein